MTKGWLQDLSIAALALAFASALIILLDLRRRPQSMAVMNPVWPITALYLGPLALWAYWRLGRAPPAKPDPPRHHHHNHHHEHHTAADRPFWQQAFAGTTHCGAGCTIGDILAEFLVFLAGLGIAGSAFNAELVLDYVFAFGIGIVFQYYAVVPMRGLRPIPGIIAALKADFWSLTAFEVGLFGWMALMRFVFFGPGMQPDSPVYWFMMQIGMTIGFMTSFPMNWLLIRSGVKEPCM